MKKLLFLLFWASFLAPNLQAQSTQSLWAEMETYIINHLEDPIPEEAKMIQLFSVQEEEPHVKGNKLVELVRRNYWQKKFIVDNKERVDQAKEAERNDTKMAVEPIHNPDLVEICPIEIVVIIDRSSSINQGEIPNIKAGLSALVSNMIGTGNSLTFIGMGGGSGDVGGPAIISERETYNPGNPNIHLNWIDILSFGTCYQCDSWSTGLEAAIDLDFDPDLVLMITDGNDDHPANEDDLTIAAANALKSNGANGGTGAHIFVFGEEKVDPNSNTNDIYEDYGSPSLEIEFSEAVDLFIAEDPLEAPVPPTFSDLGTSDYIGFPNNSDFADLANWLSGLEFSGRINTVNISLQPCDDDFRVRGKYELCQGAISSVNLQIWENGMVLTTVAASINTNNNIWSFSTSYSQLESLGLEYGNSYDIIPVMTLDDGTVITGSSFVLGPDNDFLFEEVDCCDIDDSLYSVPECVRQGEEFTVIVELEGNVEFEEIDEIYSNDNNYTYVSHFVLNLHGETLVFITFISNTCTCEGEMLIFDIRLTDCAEVIWIMTDNIPCCADECETVTIQDWYAEDCTIINGNPARYFCLEVSSIDPITDVFATTNTVFCQTTLVELEVNNLSGSNNYSICGFMVFDDPNCTGHAKVSLKVETESTCCLIEQSFSFPKGCGLERSCLKSAANFEIIIGKGMDISIGIPQGEVVTVFDHIANSTNDYTVGLVHCGPFMSSSSGGINPGPLDCNGIVLPTPNMADCFNTETSDPIVNYHYEITWNNCVWDVIGNLCDEPLVTFSPPGFTGRNASVEEDENSFSDPIKVFPNPVDQSGFLNFDFGNLKTPVSTIEVRDVSGKIMESFIPVSGQNKFQHQLNQPLSKGIYFLVFYLEDGQVRSTKLVSLD